MIDNPNDIFEDGPEGSLDYLLARLHGGTEKADNDRRGKQFEHICQWILEYVPEFADELEQVWPWAEWPGSNGEPDCGIDLVARHKDGSLWAVQAKCWRGSISRNELAKFIANSGRRAFGFKHKLLIATTDKLSTTALTELEAHGIHKYTLADLRALDVAWPENPQALIPPDPEPKVPFDYQVEAIEEVVAGLEEHGKGKMIMPCGTGKTLTSLFISEFIGARRVLVALPSLALERQVMRNYMANRNRDLGYDYPLAVGSDETVQKDKYDALRLKQTDLAHPVTTDSDKIAKYLRRRKGGQMVFATYQSIDKVAAACKKTGIRFDLMVADEAHHCAAQNGTSNFATVLDPKKIPAQHRLFQTATPRIWTARAKKKASENDFDVTSMDNDDLFGPDLHYLSVNDAIGKKLLTPYHVAIFAVGDEESFEYISKQIKVRHPELGNIATDQLATYFGALNTIKKEKLRRLISFHSSIERAEEWTRNLPEINDCLPPRMQVKGLWSQAVSSKMTPQERDNALRRLEHLRDGEVGILCNVRCLGEGVDVPALDGIIFVDPKGSELDIVQAVGRAVRLAPNKEHGYIIIPAFVTADGDAESALDDSSYKLIRNVLLALRAHDERFVVVLDRLRSEPGTGKGFPKDLISLTFPKSVPENIERAIEARIVELTTNSFAFWFGLLEKFVARDGHAQVPVKHEEDAYRLGSWLNKFRTKYKNGLLPREQIERVEALHPSWTWDARKAEQIETFETIKQFVLRSGYLPRQRHDEPGRCVSNARTSYKRGALDADLVARYETEIPGWTWKGHTGSQSTTGFPGVAKSGHGYVAYVKQAGVRVHVGLFATAEEARRERARFLATGMKPQILRRDNRSGYPGVSWDSENNKWLAKLERKYLGRYDTPEEAARAVELAKEEGKAA